MPYYVTPTKPLLPGGATEPVLPLDIVNWAGNVTTDDRYAIFSRATVDLTLYPLISIVTRAQASALTGISEDDLSRWDALSP